jgi:hypothetical protein
MPVAAVAMMIHTATFVLNATDQCKKHQTHYDSRRAMPVATAATMINGTTFVLNAKDQCKKHQTYYNSSVITTEYRQV